MSKIASLLAAATLVAFAMPVDAHSQVVTVENDLAGTVYLFGGFPWLESNGVTSGGVMSYLIGFDGDSGLQAHPTCAGTYTANDVVAWNYASSDGHFGYNDGSADFSNNDLNYIPFSADGAGFYGDADFTAEGCAALGGTYVEADTPLLPLPQPSFE